MQEINIKLFTELEAKLRVFKILDSQVESKRSDIIYDLEEIHKLNNEHPVIGIYTTGTGTKSSWDLKEFYNELKGRNYDVRWALIVKRYNDSYYSVNELDLTEGGTYHQLSFMIQDLY